MATYTDWNRAIVDYFLSTTPRGYQIYLSLDEDTLEVIGEQLSPQLTEDNWCIDFQKAVRRQIVTPDGKGVTLEYIQGKRDDIPYGVAFLGTCTLAAYLMANDEETSELNYFKHLKNILGLNDAKCPRFKGMMCGSTSEEPLWKQWNYWLLERGFQPSAKQGSGKPKRYINYPISQCLLRKADKDRLCQLFASQSWKQAWDAQTLLSKVRTADVQLSSHLRELLQSRREVLADAIHEVYQHWLETGSLSPDRYAARNRTLFSGLYRTEDPCLGDIEYLLYPKQNRGQKLSNVEVDCEGETHFLQVERPGWYMPIGEPLSEQKLSQGWTGKIQHPDSLEKLILPSRDFWILVPDPENSESGVFASWRSPELGVPFTLLYRKHLQGDLDLLRNEQLIQWQNVNYPFGEESNWLELDGCMVISQAWDGIFPKCSDLKDALQPSTKLSISLSGGLQVPGERGWLSSYPTSLTVFGFMPKANLQIVRLPDDVTIYDETVPTNHSIALPRLSKGSYIATAKDSSGKPIAERSIRILDWAELAIAPQAHSERTILPAERALCGARCY